MESCLAIIGGSGLYSLGEDFQVQKQLPVETPYGATSANIQLGSWQGSELVFLPRHGAEHSIPPHRINYRANLWALKHLGVDRIMAVNAVGGIGENMAPLTLALPDQIIDYSSAREGSFFDGEDGRLEHIDFTWPYSASLRSLIMQAALEIGQALVATGTYACSNGPRLETAAEIRRMKNDGCHMVGMTGMPEAALARELDIEYLSLALVVNWGAGISAQTLSMDEIHRNLELGMDSVKALLLAAERQATK